MKLFYFLFVSLLFIPFTTFSQNTPQDNFAEFYKKAYSEANSEIRLQYAFKALEIANKLQNDSLTASGLVAVSNCYRVLGNLTLALEFALKAEPYFKKINTEDGNVMLNLYIAGIYGVLKNNKLAIEYYKKSLQYKTKYANITIANLLNIGELFRKDYQYDSALYYLKSSEEISTKESSFEYNAYLYSNLGLVYAAQNKKILTDSLLTKAIELFIAANDYKALTQTYFELAKIEYEHKNTTIAYQLANKAYATADTNQYILELKDISQLLAQISEDRQEFVQAYKYLKSYNLFKEAVASDSILSKLSEMRAEFEIQRKEEEVIYFKKISKARTTIAFISLIGLGFILMLVVFLLRVIKQRKQANIQLAIFNSELQNKNLIINRALEEKEVLIKEIHHRVKNNLQIISSIINLQSMRIKNKAVNEIFDEMQRRILAISSIHQKLYQSESVASINMDEYLTEVVESIHTAFSNPQIIVAYEIEIKNVSMDIDAAISIGLIVNELTTNAYKYAFTENLYNLLTIKLLNTSENHFVLEVHDNGKGLPEGFNLSKSNSLGLRMVSLLTRQLNGIISISNSPGAKFTISLER
ncbi:MAG: histidine kinase dimerization/phosphoacceptor domain -containing protein [Salinivirgaceae bacterium]